MNGLIFVAADGLAICKNQRSKQLEDDDPSVRLVLVDVCGTLRARHAIEGQFEAGLGVVAARAFFSLANLLDDERR
jgi:hypothetical protein